VIRRLGIVLLAPRCCDPVSPPLLRPCLLRAAMRLNKPLYSALTRGIPEHLALEGKVPEFLHHCEENEVLQDDDSA